MDENYQPVNCDFYDELEAIATLKKTCEIIFLNNGSKTQLRTGIVDLYTRDKIEYMKTSSGLEIRLDKLLKVDGKIPSNYC